jgi:hypothetical protein
VDKQEELKIDIVVADIQKMDIEAEYRACVRLNSPEFEAEFRKSQGPTPIGPPGSYLWASRYGPAPIGPVHELMVKRGHYPRWAPD